MSTFQEVKKRCAVCRKVSSHTQMMSSNSMGAPDLDTRPPEMLRSTIGLWVEKCPFCGYVSPDLRIPTSAGRAFLRGERYMTCGGRDIKSETARRFYQAYMITRKENGTDEEMFIYLLYAAWASDDADDREMAVLFRKGAVRALDRMDSPGEKYLVMKADIMRRAGMYDRVIREFKDFTSGDEMLRKVIRFQIRKCRVRDHARYTMADLQKSEV